jgi:hypothetical protein
MANYVFEADTNFNRVILEDIEKNRVFVNSQLELDFYTAVRPGGPFNGSYWQQIGNAGVIPDSTLQIAQEEYKQKQEQGDVIVSSDTNLASLNLSGPDGDDEGEGDGASGSGSAVASQTSANTYAQGIPSGGEITKVGDLYYILYTIPDTNIPISYEATEQDIRGLFPLDFDQQQFKSLTTAEFNQLGAIDFGNVAELYDPRLISQGMTPWEGFIDYLDKEAELRPWLADEEMVFLLAESTLEGRTVTEAEWKTTDWWRTHTQDERDWLLLSQGKAIDELPADAQSKPLPPEKSVLE